MAKISDDIPLVPSVLDRLLDDEPEDVARQRQALRRQMTGVARQVSLDPADGMDL